MVYAAKRKRSEIKYLWATTKLCLLNGRRTMVRSSYRCTNKPFMPTIFWTREEDVLTKNCNGQDRLEEIETGFVACSSGPGASGFWIAERLPSVA